MANLNLHQMEREIKILKHKKEASQVWEGLLVQFSIVLLDCLIRIFLKI
jgi:hypothetical protein